MVNAIIAIIVGVQGGEGREKKLYSSIMTQGSSELTSIVRLHSRVSRSLSLSKD